MNDVQLSIKALGESAWYQRGEMDAESLMNVLSRVANTHETLLVAIEAKQAQIDALMLEFCPAEMTATQKLEWARRQKVSANSIAHAAPSDADRLAEALQPFANLLQPHHASIPDDRPIYGINKAEITAGDLRRANEALTAHSAQAQPHTVHPEHSCEECGGQNVTWFAPSELWNDVVRGPNGRDLMLCPMCFIKRAEKIGQSNDAWSVRPEFYEESAQPPAASVPDGLVGALRHQRQIDEDGQEVGVSRQAVDEAANILAALAAQENPNG